MKPISQATHKPDKTKSYLLLASGVIFITFLLFGLTLVLKQRKAPAPHVAASLSPPVFSVASGFYREGFRLKITTDHPGAQIYFTTDGSIPTKESEVYKEPVLITPRLDEPNVLSEIKNSPVFAYPLTNVFKGTVVRAIIAVNDTLLSAERQASYFIHPEGRSRYSLPVFSLIINRDDFFGYKNGIYVNGATTDDKDYYLKNNIDIASFKEGFPTNYKRKGKRWEREVRLEFFEKGTNKGFTAKAGARIHGNATRERPQKSLKFYFEQQYGFPVLNYPLFGKQGPKLSIRLYSGILARICIKPACAMP